ncbi:LysR family transcriptional regulator [Rhizobium rhizogenes]|uniref:LysR family transcriptional regulator n=1 Tax=Rhizobium rhizogenes TaxID=359 RepID=UPI001F1B02C5|nr:LysR family transcriptional regulator [Rhizobium rhizogenes]
MTLESIEIFVEVIDAQSFTRAAARLGIPTTTISAKIARLEQRLGVTLIHRTTRRLQVTPAGNSYYQHCIRALAEIAEGERELAARVQEPVGLLRITAPADLTQNLLTPVAERFLHVYPKASIEFVVTNQIIDLISESVDLAVRVGPLDDSSLIARKFRSGRIALWAAPSYLERMGTPRTPEELKWHEFIRFTRLRDTVVLKSSTGAAFDADFGGRLASDDFDNLKTLILRGGGIGLLPEFIGEGMGAPSSLVRVLPDYASDVSTVYFAYPAQRFVPQTVRAFIATATGERI